MIFPTQQELDDEPPDDPVLICSLWRSWVCTCCDWDKVERPTSAEWQVLEAGYHESKTPKSSFEDLVKLRNKG